MWQSRDRTHSGLRLGLCLTALTPSCTDPRYRLRTRVLLVDAYNVLNEWPTLAALFEAGQLEAAREGLVAELKGFAHFRGAASAACLRSRAKLTSNVVRRLANCGRVRRQDVDAEGGLAA